MAYTRSDLESEARDIIERRLADGQPAPAAWIVQEILANHTNLMTAPVRSVIGDDDVAFYLCCAQAQAQVAVRESLRDFERREKEEDDDDREPFLPGFPRIQRRYLIERDGERVVIPFMRMTKEEVIAKAAEHGRMAAGSLEHQQQLLRYVEEFMGQPANDAEA